MFVQRVRHRHTISQKQVIEERLKQFDDISESENNIRSVWNDGGWKDRIYSLERMVGF